MNTAGPTTRRQHGTSSTYWKNVRAPLNILAKTNTPAWMEQPIMPWPMNNPLMTLATAPHRYKATRQKPAWIAITRFVSLKKRSEEHTSELQSRGHLVCRLLL